MSNILLAPTLFIGSMLYMFLYWRRLKEDVPSNDVFTSGLLILVSGYTGALVAFLVRGIVPGSVYFNPEEMWFWLAFVFIIVSTLYVSRKYRQSYYEIFEGVGVGVFPLYSFVLVYFGISNHSVETLVFGTFILTFVALFYYFQATYRNFRWYKSGKVGFSGLVSLALLFFFRTLIAGLHPSMVSFTGRVEIVLSGVVSFILIFLVYNLAEY